MSDWPNKALLLKLAERIFFSDDDFGYVAFSDPDFDPDNPYAVYEPGAGPAFLFVDGSMHLDSETADMLRTEWKARGR